ncbi:MAG TPA: copper resistance protein B [Steroidobacteraceae bacterium]|nr:copper resistance protein B [Steroidobacteraceae bacterium]
MISGAARRMLCLACLLGAGAAAAQEPLPPEPIPQREMARMMEMDDTAAVGKLLFNQLEWRDGQGSEGPAWDVQGWYGSDYNKLWLKTEGVRLDSTTRDARAELLWDRIFSRWWSSQAGIRHDFGDGPARNWLALGVAGLAPYFVHIEATAYVGDAGRTAGRLRADYEILFTQRTILQPEFELNAYGKDDPERHIGAGLADVQLGLRVRYEIRRELAPYLGVAWLHTIGKTADMVRAAGEETSVVQFVAGIRFWL